MNIQINKNGKIVTVILDVAKIEMVDDVELLTAVSHDSPIEKPVSRFNVYSSSNCLLYQRPFFHQSDAEKLMKQITEDPNGVIQIEE